MRPQPRRFFNNNSRSSWTTKTARRFRLDDNPEWFAIGSIGRSPSLGPGGLGSKFWATGHPASFSGTDPEFRGRPPAAQGMNPLNSLFEVDFEVWLRRLVRWNWPRGRMMEPCNPAFPGSCLAAKGPF